MNKKKEIPVFKLSINEEDQPTEGITRISIVDLEKFHGFPFMHFSHVADNEPPCKDYEPK
jgi:hypothetical protein